MSGCGCNNAVKIEPRIVGKQIKKSTTSKCLNYGGYNNNNINLQSNVSFNYGPIDRYQYYRITPNYLRAFEPFSVVPFEDTYEEAIAQDSEQGRCLRAQVISGPIKLWTLEEMFIKLVPAVNDLPLLVEQKNLIRNQWVAFCLNIEKTFLEFEKGKLTCNNNIVPWNAYFNLTSEKNGAYTFLNANEVPLTNYDQTIIYKLANNFNLNFLIKKTNPFNYYNILRKALNIPIVGSETPINFYELVYITYILLQELFTISQTLLLGKDPGLPQEFIDLYFPPNYQRYYYNYYLSWIESRNRRLGFGSRINVSNGSGTYIKIPGVIIDFPNIPTA